MVAGSDGSIHEADEVCCELLGYAASELVGQPLTTIIPDRLRAEHELGFGRWAASAELRLGGQPLPLVARHRDGHEIPVTVTLHHIERGGGREAVGFLKPVHADSSHHAELSARILSTLGQELPFDQLVGAVLADLTDHLGWDHGLAWLPDEPDGVLRLAAWWSKGDDGFARESAELAFDSGEGLVGASFEAAEAVWVEDVLALGHYHRDDLASRHGITSAIYFPLMAGDERVGAVELVSRARRGIDTETNAALELLSRELGAIIRQRRDMERNEAQRRRLDLAVEAAELGTWTLDLAHNRVEVSAHLAELHGLDPEPIVESFDDFVGRVHADHRAAVRQRMEQAGRDGQRFDHLYPIVRPDGREVWLRGSGQGLVDADGRLRSVTGIAFDVTDSLEYATLQEERMHHASLVAEVGEVLTREGLNEAVLQRVAQSAVDHLGAAFARIWTIDERESELLLRASAGMYTHLDGDHARIPVGQYKIGRIAQRQQPHLTNDVLHDPEVSDPDWAAREGMVAFAGYPLMVAGRCTGVLGLFARQPLDHSALEVLGTVADMVALADARDRLYRQRAEVADVLQRSLLPPALPEVPGLHVGVAYQPSVGDVSGDFYDVFPVGNDTWAAMIGDVCGKGPKAAASTSLARHTIRTAAMLESGAAAPLRALNTALLVAGSEMCTAIFARMSRTDDGVRMTIARAGHPPPIVHRADGSVHSLLLPGAIVGVFPETSLVERDVVLAPGDTMVLVTDGVLETRCGDEFFGEERLCSAIVEHAERPVAELAKELLEAASAFNDRRSVDDIAVLVLRATP